jgi:cell division protein FtsN
VPPAAAAVAQRPAPAPSTAVGACRIQAGVFSQRANADNLAKAMQPLGDVRITEMQSNGKVVYSVALAGLPSRKDAESALSKLNSDGKLGARITGCRAAAD